MSENIPTTDEVRRSFANNPPGDKWNQRREVHFEAFDRWLTEIKATAWDEGYAEGWNERESNEFQPTNPYRAALGLTAGQEGGRDE